MEKSEIRNPKSEIRIGGLVLCGGKSSRMGLSKATLPFGPELMLLRVVRLLSSVAQPIVVVAASGQDLPPLPSGVILARDDKSVFVRADAGASVQDLMDVTDKLKAAGVEKVGLMSKPIERR